MRRNWPDSRSLICEVDHPGWLHWVWNICSGVHSSVHKMGPNIVFKGCEVTKARELRFESSLAVDVTSLRAGDEGRAKLVWSDRDCQSGWVQSGPVRFRKATNPGRVLILPNLLNATHDGHLRHPRSGSRCGCQVAGNSNIGCWVVGACSTSGGSRTG